MWLSVIILKKTTYNFVWSIHFWSSFLCCEIIYSSESNLFLPKWYIFWLSTTSFLIAHVGSFLPKETNKHVFTVSSVLNPTRCNYEWAALGMSCSGYRY